MLKISFFVIMALLLVGNSGKILAQEPDLSKPSIFLSGSTYYKDSVIVFLNGTMIFNQVVETTKSEEWPAVITLPNISLMDTSVVVKVVVYTSENVGFMPNRKDGGLLVVYPAKIIYRAPFFDEIVVNIPKQGRYICYENGTPYRFIVQKGIPYLCGFSKLPKE